jgi:hypothetical protein
MAGGRFMPTYPRNLIGYGESPPFANWPGEARIALSFVLNYEEGGEMCVLHGDPASEAYLHEVPKPSLRVFRQTLLLPRLY